MVGRFNQKVSDAYWQWTGLSCFLAVFLVLPCYVFVELESVTTDILSDVYVFIPAVYFVLTCCILFFSERPSSRKGWLLLLLSHTFVIAALILLASHARHYYLIRSVGLIFRLCLIAAVGIPLAGLVLLAETIRRGRLRWKPWIPKALGLSFTVGIAAIGCEVAAQLLQSSPDTGMQLPELSPVHGRQPVLVAAIGGSTMQGFPYAPYYGISQVTEWQLRQSGAEDFELVNLAITGASLSITAAELKRLDRHPDILIVYSGHNEFFHELLELGVAHTTDFGRIDELLRHSATFSIVNKFMQQFQIRSAVIKKSGTLIGQSLCPESVRIDRLNRYAGRLKLLFQWAKQGGTRVVFCSPAADEADFAPNKCRCRNCSESDESRLLSDWKLVRRHQAAEAFELAAQICEDAIAQFPDVAEFYFRAGECYLRMNRPDDARQHFQIALELDQFPIRARESYRQAGLQLAEEFGLTTINTAQLLRENTVDGLLSREVFLDGVHLNLRGIYIVGTEIAQRIVAAGLLKVSSPSSAEGGFVDSLQDLGMTSETLASAYETTSKVMKRYAVFRDFDQTPRLQLGESYAVMAEQLRTGAVIPGQAGTESLSDEFKVPASQRGKP